MNKIRTWLASDSAKRVYRTFVIAFVGVSVPGLFGWLNGLTEWARSEGQAPFPDAHSLAFLGVSAIVAGCVAVVNLLVVGLEDATGKRVMRPQRAILGKSVVSPLDPRPTEKGISDVAFLAAVVVIALVVLIAVGAIR